MKCHTARQATATTLSITVGFIAVVSDVWARCRRIATMEGREEIRPAAGWRGLLLTAGAVAWAGMGNPIVGQEVVSFGDPRAGYIGLSYRPLDVMETDITARRFPIVTGVYPCSPVHRAGLEPGDVLERVNDRDAREPGRFPGDVGTEYTVEVRRGGEILVVSFERIQRPPELPEPVRAAPVGTLERWNCDG